MRGLLRPIIALRKFVPLRAVQLKHPLTTGKVTKGRSSPRWRSDVSDADLPNLSISLTVCACSRKHGKSRRLKLGSAPVHWETSITTLFPCNFSTGLESHGGQGIPEEATDAYAIPRHTRSWHRETLHRWADGGYLFVFTYHLLVCLIDIRCLCLLLDYVAQLWNFNSPCRSK